MNRAVAIVGGGWAGLACALELAGAGVPVTLFEAARQLGGRARGVAWDGIRIDNGQHLMLGAYRETQRLLARLGTLDRLERRPLQLRLPDYCLRLPRLPAPLHLAAGLALARGLGARDKLAALRFMRGLDALGFRLPADCTAQALLAAWRQPPGLIDRLWAPICIAALNTPLEAASAQVFCTVLKDGLMGARADSDLLMNRADLSRLLPDAAAACLERRGARIQLSARVTALSARPGAGYQLHGPERAAARVVLAVHPARLPALLAHLPALSAVARQAAALAWQPILTLWLRLARPVAFPFPMLGLGPGQAPWAFERDDLAPGTVAIVISAEGPHLNQAPEALRDACMALLARALGPLPPLRAWKTIVERRATYACVPGLARPGNITPLPGLYLAGDYTAGPYPATIEGAVRSGVECARLILEAPDSED